MSGAWSALQADVVVRVQSVFAPGETWQIITRCADPANAFLVLIPALAGIFPGNAAALVTLCVLIFADYSNAVFLKWPLGHFLGNRPYWVDSRVAETRWTCETGFGFPSGHAMVSAATFITLARSVPLRDRTRSLLVFCAFTLSSAAGLSRVVIGAHSIDQVVAGLAIGVATAQFLPAVIHKLLSRAQKRPIIQLHYAYALAIASGLGVYGLAATMMWALRGAGLDPLASVALARAGCDGPLPTYIASPLEHIARDAGATAGLVLEILRLASTPIAIGRPGGAVAAFAGVFGAQVLAAWKPATQNMTVLVPYAFVQFFAVTTWMFRGAPRAAQSITRLFIHSRAVHKQ